jgi:hypothetical protein
LGSDDLAASPEPTSKEAAMARELARHNRPVSDQLHPTVYAAMVGLVLLFVVSAWACFGGGAYVGLLLAVMSSFFLIAVAVPFALWLTWRRHPSSDAAQGQGISLRDWASGEFDTWQDRRKAADAAIEVLLPIAAVAFGMAALGMVFFIEISVAQL